MPEQDIINVILDRENRDLSMVSLCEPMRSRQAHEDARKVIDIRDYRPLQVLVRS